MPLPLLLALVGAGIAGIAVLLHVTGRSERRILDSATARAEWLRHYPEDRVDEVTVSRDGHAALVRTGAGLGLLWAFGADTAARPLRDFDLLSDKGRLAIAFRDYTAPRVRLDLDPAERPAWERLLSERGQA